MIVSVFKTLKHFCFKYLRRFLKINSFLKRIVLRTLKTRFKKFTTFSIDFLSFFIETKIIKPNENHNNILHEKYKYIDICFAASDG